LAEQIPAITYVAALGSDGTPVHVSPQIERLLGYPQAQHSSDSSLWRRSIHPEDAPRVLAEMARCHATGAPFLCEYRMLASGGRTVWLRDQATLVRDAQSRALMLEGVMLDISAQKAVETELELTNKALHALLEASPLAFITLDLEQRVRAWNPAAERM